MRWIADKVKQNRFIKKGNIILRIDKNIPGDLFHLEFPSINIIEDHDNEQYLYIITDKLDDYDDDDMVPIFDTFFIKYNDELIDTTIHIADYIER